MHTNKDIISMLIDCQGYDKSEAEEVALSVGFDIKRLASEYFPSDETALEEMKQYLKITI